MTAKYLSLIIVLFALSGCSPTIPTVHSPDTTRLYFLDVGEGAATLIDNPDLGRVLIDTGNPSSKLVSRLSGMGIDRLAAVIITHPHPDHAGGIYSILEFLSPLGIYDNGEILALSDPHHRWYNNRVRLDPRYRMLRAGDRLQAGISMIEVLSPDVLVDDWNTNSLVLAFTVGPIKVLLMADANLTTETKFLNGNHDLSAHILQVGHHGSDHGSSQRFLEAVSPQFAVVSVNRDNVNGYPAAQTLTRLKKQGSEVRLTSKNGDIVFEIQPLTKSIRVLHNHE